MLHPTQELEPPANPPRFTTTVGTTTKLYRQHPADARCRRPRGETVGAVVGNSGRDAAGRLPLPMACLPFRHALDAVPIIRVPSLDVVLLAAVAFEPSLTSFPCLCPFWRCSRIGGHRTTLHRVTNSGIADTKLRPCDYGCAVSRLFRLGQFLKPVNCVRPPRQRFNGRLSSHVNRIVPLSGKSMTACPSLAQRLNVIPRTRTLSSAG